MASPKKRATGYAYVSANTPVGARLPGNVRYVWETLAEAEVHGARNARRSLVQVVEHVVVAELAAPSKLRRDVQRARLDGRPRPGDWAVLLPADAYDGSDREF